MRLTTTGRSKPGLRAPATLHWPTTATTNGSSLLSSRMKMAFICTHITLFVCWTASLLHPNWNARWVSRAQQQLQAGDSLLSAFPSAALNDEGEGEAARDNNEQEERPALPHKRYHEVNDLVETNAKPFPHDYVTAYTQSGAGTHKRTCSVERVAIPLAQDEHHIINTLDAHDLADVTLQHYASYGHLEFFGNSLTPEMLPCLLPGTIISIDNHIKAQRYFFDKLRPHIQVPYILIVSESDGNTPERQFAPKVKSDDLLLKFYGTNPDMHTVDLHEARHKFEPMPLGLAKFHRQTPYLYNYLKVNNFTSPFADLTRWTSRLAELQDPDNDNLNDVLFVKFNVHQYAKHRQTLHDKLCKDIPTTLKDDISCSDKSFSPHETYNASSHYLFGMSPPGAGWDCYRTYELLLAGVIPIIDGRPGSRELFRDLPVIHVPQLVPNTTRTRQDFRTIIADYVNSDEFTKGNFTAGFERLFLRYWRHKLLRDAGRHAEILTDPNNTGQQYYQAYRYTATKRPARVYCGSEGNCETKD